MGLELIRWKSNERVGLPDQEAMSDLLLEEMIREKGELVLRDTQGARVFGGFLLTDLGAGLARLDQGRAVMKVLKDQVESHGFFLGLQSPTSYQLDFSGAADDTYDVYIRAAYTDATFENRVFWSPSASAEVVDYTATRQRVTWEATYVADSAASPGSEWVRVWSVTVASGAITGTTDRRPFYFEGDPVTTFGLQWGDGATDRNADRASYGAQDRWTWDQAVRRQIADIIGSPVGAHTFWPVAPIELTQLAAEHYAEADGSGQRGKHKTINFGATGQFWQLSAAAADSAFISATEETTNTPHLEMEMGEFGGGPNRKVLLRLEPYGGLGGQNVGDFAGTAEFGGEVSCVTSYTAVNTYITTWNRLTQDVMRLDVGAALPEEGLHILSGATYSDEGFRADSGEFLISATKDVYIPLPWSALLPDDSGSRSWEMSGPASGDVGGANVTVRSIGSISGSKPVFFEFYNFPVNGTLLAIDVTWRQDSTGATNEMRMYAARHVNVQTRPANTHDVSTDVTAGFEWQQQDLHSTQNYVEYVQAVQTAQVRRFKPDLNNTGWDRRKHKLVIGILPPDTVAAGCTIFQIMTYWRYDAVSPWGIVEGW